MKSLPRFLAALSAASVILLPALATFDLNDSAPVSLNLGNVDYFSEPIFADASKNMCVSGTGVWSYRANGSSDSMVLFFDDPLLDADGFPRPADPNDRYETWLNQVADGATGPENEAFVGRWVLEWEGTADIRLKGFDAYLLVAESDPPGSVTNGKRVYEIPVGANLVLEATGFDLADPITEINLWMPMPDRPETMGDDERFLYSCQPAERAAYNTAFGITEHPDAFHFTPQLLAVLTDRKWANLRMMDFAETNNNPTMFWNERNRPGLFSQADVRSYRDPYTGLEEAEPVERHSGIAWEYQVALANATGVDLWICVPHLAVEGGDHIEKIARAVRFGTDGSEPYAVSTPSPAWAGLDPSLNLYIEYSNEIWNGGGQFQGFDQYHWITARGVANGRTLSEQAAHYYKQVFDTFDAVWAGDLGRRLRVIAWDAPVDYYFDVLGGTCEAFARTWYFENGIVDFVNFQHLGVLQKGNIFTDPGFDPGTAFNTNAGTTTEADADEGWHFPGAHMWDLDTGRGVVEVTSSTGAPGLTQVVRDDNVTVGERTVQLTFSNTEGDAVENRLFLEIYGVDGPFSFSNWNGNPPSGTAATLLATADLAISDTTDQVDDFTVDFGPNGYEYIAVRIRAAGVDPQGGDVLEVSRIWMTQSLEYPADVADRLDADGVAAVLAEWKRRMLAGVSLVLDDTDWVEGDSFYGNGILRESKERGIPVTTYEAGAATASWQYDGGGSNDDWTTLLFERLYTDPGAAELYRLQLEKSRSAGIRGFNLFKVYGAWSKWGQWGHVRNPYADFETDPGAIRYRAVRDFHDENLGRPWPDQPVGATPTFATPALLPTASLGEAYQGVALETTGGDGPRQLSIIASVLPDGLSLNPADGRVTGTPISTDPGYLYARVSDADGDSEWKRFLLRVVAPLAAPAASLDFESLSADPTGVPALVVDGYTFTSNNDTSNNVKSATPTWTGWPRNWNSNVLWITSQQAIIEAPEGTLFDLNGIEIGSNAALSMLVEGFSGGNKVVDAIVNLDDSDPAGNANRMTAMTFGDAWRDLDRVVITPYVEADLGGGSWVGVGIDNVILNQPRPETEPDPEPEPEPVAPLLLRDTQILAAPDGSFYLTGTRSRGDDGDFDHNDGVDLWRSSDLSTWEYLGRVWDMPTAGTSTTPNKEWNVPAGRISGFPAHGMTAPEIHYVDGTYWICYSLNGQGTGLLRSTSGLPEGPYEDRGLVTTRGDDPSIVFDGPDVYWIFGEGFIARMNPGLNGLAERPRRIPLTGLEPAGLRPFRVEQSGVSIFERNGVFHLVTVEPGINGGTGSMDSVVWMSNAVDGPYWRSNIRIVDTGPLNAFADSGKWMGAFSDPGTDVPMMVSLPVDADLDADSLPDWWELRYGPNGPTSLLAGSDDDGDGNSVELEVLFRTDPNRSDSLPISFGPDESGMIKLGFSFVPLSGIPLEVEMSSELQRWDPAEPDLEEIILNGEWETRELWFSMEGRDQIFLRVTAGE